MEMAGGARVWVKAENVFERYREEKERTEQRKRESEKVKRIRQEVEGILKARGPPTSQNEHPANMKQSDAKDAVAARPFSASTIVPSSFSSSSSSSISYQTSSSSFPPYTALHLSGSQSLSLSLPSFFPSPLRSYTLFLDLQLSSLLSLPCGLLQSCTPAAASAAAEPALFLTRDGAVSARPEHGGAGAGGGGTARMRGGGQWQRLALAVDLDRHLCIAYIDGEESRVAHLSSDCFASGAPLEVREREMMLFGGQEPALKVARKRVAMVAVFGSSCRRRRFISLDRIRPSLLLLLSLPPPPSLLLPPHPLPLLSLSPAACLVFLFLSLSLLLPSLVSLSAKLTRLWLLLGEAVLRWRRRPSLPRHRFLLPRSFFFFFFSSSHPEA